MTRRRTLFQRIAIALSVLVLIGAVLLGGVAYWATPTMIVHNGSKLTVQVTAYWADKRKVLQPIEPGAKRTFRVSGESAITFVATFPDGTQVKSHPEYFTTATTVTAVVTNRGVDATAEF